MKTLNYFLFAALATLFITACSDKDDKKFEGNAVQSQKQKFGIDTITKALKNPWGLAFLPDGRILITERSGEIRIVKDGKLLEERVEGVPTVLAENQGGLLDIVLHPDFKNNGWIYFTYSKPGEGGAATTVSRAKLEGNKFTNVQDLFTALPYASNLWHYGSRIAFDGKGYMFITSGERGTKENSQDLSNHHGKIIRLHDDGQVPSDNPFVGVVGAKSEIWSYGHRNPQGLIYDAATETLWGIEHGPRGGDEINKVEKGKNYGWPVITYGINYDGTTITDLQEKEGMEQPIHKWVPSIAPCGATLVTSDKYPNWKGNMLVSALVLTHVARVEIKDGKYVGEEKLLDKIGRVRTVAQSLDGYIYVATESPGMLVRLVPVD